MDLFRRQNSIQYNRRTQDFIQPTMNNPQSYGSDSIIKNHFTLIHVYGPSNTADEDYVYQPIQAKQHCYRFVYLFCPVVCLFILYLFQAMPCFA